MVTHFNHADEFTEETLYFAKILQAGIQLINQSVLLEGINHQ